MLNVCAVCLLVLFGLALLRGLLLGVAWVVVVISWCLGSCKIVVMCCLMLRWLVGCCLRCALGYGVFWGFGCFVISLCLVVLGWCGFVGGACGCFFGVTVWVLVC